MEETKQTEDNFSLENPEVDNVVTDQREDADDFFTNLDKEVNGLILDDNTSESEAPQVEQATSEEAPVENNIDNLEKRYADSSREAKRLNQRLKELEPYSPLLDAYKNDPNLIKHTKDYFENGGQAPKTVKERLNLGEDFVFDGDEAISDPKSESAKVFGAVVDEAVNRRLSNFQRNQAVSAKKEADVNSFREKHDISNEDYNELVDYAKSRTLTLEDIYYLKNRSERDMNVARATRDGMREQMQNVRQKPTSLSHTGSNQVDQSAEDSIFDSILGIDNKLEEAFG
tara:strand:+ start:7276 stop:8133 length:858 start_codon:yes stop_codon:yes gene_type:complete